MAKGRVCEENATPPSLPNVFCVSSQTRHSFSLISVLTALITHCMQHACKQSRLSWQRIQLWMFLEFKIQYFSNSIFNAPFICDSPVFNPTNDLQLAYALSTEKFKCIYCRLDNSVLFKKYLLGLCFYLNVNDKILFFPFWFELFSCIVSTSIAVFNNVYRCVLCGK